MSQLHNWCRSDILARTKLLGPSRRIGAVTNQFRSHRLNSKEILERRNWNDAGNENNIFKTKTRIKRKEIGRNTFLRSFQTGPTNFDKRSHEQIPEKTENTDSSINFTSKMSPEEIRKTKVLVAMSGGVDSSVSALLLKKAGYKVEGVFMHNWEEEGKGACTSKADWEDVQKVGNQIQIPVQRVN